ncbi:hypothetical protein JW911_04710 [Candidatus Peregrinibacteria bacterium]|nr:hypothetical protein [Candidatus Peregrinibacteria bacterium]
MSNDQFKINPELIVGQGLNPETSPVLYSDDEYRILGPLDGPLNSLGVLLPGEKDNLKILSETRERAYRVITDDVELLSIILNTGNRIPQALVNIPLGNYVCLEKFAATKDAKKITGEILERERARGIYKNNIAIGDFWIEPATGKLFFVALHKLK